MSLPTVNKLPHIRVVICICCAGFSKSIKMHFYSMQLICIVLGLKSCSLHWSQMVFFLVGPHGQEPILCWLEIIFVITGFLLKHLELRLINLITEDHLSLTHHQAESKISALVQHNSRDKATVAGPKTKFKILTFKFRYVDISHRPRCSS